MLEEILGIGKITGITEAHLGQEVKFSGRSSGLSSGKVIAVDVSLYINISSTEQLFFTDQLVTTALSQPGDSGSLLVDQKNRAAGLLFAGSEKVSICNRIENVFKLLEIVI